MKINVHYDKLNGVYEASVSNCVYYGLGKTRTEAIKNLKKWRIEK